MPSLELCYECDQPTGRAGAAEDSLYLGSIGPFCEECYEEWPENMEILVRHLKSELTAAKAEIERLRGRVAEQHAALESICKCCWGGREVMDVGQAATWMQFTAEKAIDDAPKTQAWLLRQKAETVSDFAKHIKENHAEVMAVWILRDAEQYIQRLRDKADNLEVGGGQ